MGDGEFIAVRHPIVGSSAASAVLSLHLKPLWSIKCLSFVIWKRRFTFSINFIWSIKLKTNCYSKGLSNRRCGILIYKHQLFTNSNIIIAALISSNRHPNACCSDYLSKKNGSFIQHIHWLLVWGFRCLKIYVHIVFLQFSCPFTYSSVNSSIFLFAVAALTVDAHWEHLKVFCSEPGGCNSKPAEDLNSP